MEKSLAELEVLRAYGHAKPKGRDGVAVRALGPSLGDGENAGFSFDDDSHVRPETSTASYATRLAEIRATIRTGLGVTGALRRGDAIHGIDTTAGPIEGEIVLIASGATSGNVASHFGARLPVKAGKGCNVTIPT